jgi:hypothetical protein
MFSLSVNDRKMLRGFVKANFRFAVYRKIQEGQVLLIVIRLLLLLPW